MTHKNLETNPVIVELITRIEFLEEELEKLTNIVKAMSDHLIKLSDGAKEFKDKKNEPIYGAYL